MAKCQQIHIYLQLNLKKQNKQTSGTETGSMLMVARWEGERGWAKGEPLRSTN